MIGETMFVSGLAMFAIGADRRPAPTKFDPRYMLIGGFLLFAVGTWQMTYLTKDWDFWELFVAADLARLRHDVRDRADQQHRARHPAARPREECLRPVQSDAQSRRRGRPRRAQHMLNDRIDLHLARLHEAVTWSRRPAAEMLADLTARFHDFGSDAQPMALKQMILMVRQQATVMSFADVFLMLTVLFVVARRARHRDEAAGPGPGAPAGH